MPTVAIRLPETKHQRLNAIARARGVSLNKLVEECATDALARFDAGIRYRTCAALGKPAVDRVLLDKLDRALLRTRVG